MKSIQQRLLYLCFISFVIFSCKKDPTVIGLSEAEKSFLPHQVGDTIRFKSDKGNKSKWVVKSREPIERLQKSGFTGPGTIYCYFRVILSNEDAEELFISYSFYSTFGPHHFAQIEHRYSTDNGIYYRDNDSGDNFDNLNELNELKTYVKSKPDFWLKFEKNKGLVSYKLDSIQTYEKY